MERERTGVSRRVFLKRAAVGGVGLTVAGGLPTPWPRSPAAARGAVTLADIGVGDPGGDWSRFSGPAGWDVKLVAMGNAPSAVLNVLIAGGGSQIYDVVNIVGGMQKPLVENHLIEVLDTSRLSNWGKDTYIGEFLAQGKPGFEFIGYDGKIYGVPTVLQGDSFAYLPEKTGSLDSYGALFDPRWKGFVALEDNYTTTGQKTALYLQKNKLAAIKDPANMTPSEIKTVVDFLVEKKKAGQFRVIWSSFEQAVSLLTSREVYVMDCWEPMVFAAKKKGVNAVYAAPKEGYLLWAMAAYVVKNPKRPAEQEAATYALLDFMLGGWYGAKIALTRGYMTNPGAAAYARSNPKEFTPGEAQEIAAIDANVRRKFQLGGTWQNRWPTHVEKYEAEWARFKAA
jgi:putative spermidine/putrescine transport system substrate-binding protein